MKWKIIFSEDANFELDEIYEYIDSDLQNPIAAKNQVTRIVNAINSLEFEPERFKYYDEEPWRSKNIRSLKVNNYLILYTPDKENKSVKIIHIVYGKRNINRILQETEDI